MGKSGKDVEEARRGIAELANVLADRDGEVEVFPIVFGEKLFQKRAEEKTLGGAEKLFRFKTAEMEKGRAAPSEGNRS